MNLKFERTMIKFFRIMRVAVLLQFAACASYQSHLQTTRNQIAEGEYLQAESKLKPLADTPSKDQLVYVLDYATQLQIAGKYKESNEYFQKADKIADLQDYFSVSKETGAIITSEQVVQYKGNDFEIVLINAMSAINYLMLEDRDAALVEIRRMNDKINRFRANQHEGFEKNVFALYLAASIWEADKKYDDAYISCKDAHDVDPYNKQIRECLVRVAKKSGREDEYKKWKSEFSEIEEQNWWYDKSVAEVIVIHQQGWGPRKVPRYDAPRYPMMQKVYSRISQIEVFVDSERVGVSEPLSNITDIAIKSLNDEYGRLVARRVGGVVAKAVVADQIRQKNEALGNIAWILLNVTDQADDRQWSTLPNTFRILRFPLKAGSHEIQIKKQDPLDQNLMAPEVLNLSVKPKETKFLNIRTF